MKKYRIGYLLGFDLDYNLYRQFTVKAFTRNLALRKLSRRYKNSKICVLSVKEI